MQDVPVLLPSNNYWNQVLPISLVLNKMKRLEAIGYILRNHLTVAVSYTHLDVYKRQGVGTVTRTWTVEDKQGYKNSCVQVITLIDDDPFWVNEENHLDPFDDIVWPLNYETKKCHSVLDPSNLPAPYDKPTFSDDNCSLVAIHHKDQVFKFVDGACEKILRTWTVIDWCTYNDNIPGYKPVSYTHLDVYKRQVRSCMQSETSYFRK